MSKTELIKNNGFWKGNFMAMASPCDVLMEVEDKLFAQHLLDAIASEAWRIENKFSRYRNDNIIYQINHSMGAAVSIDEETERLLAFADQLFQLSDGLFDVTSGVLRRLWTFDGSDRLAKGDDVRQILRHVGWHRVDWQGNRVSLPAAMEIDLGGIGKEYAVDRCIQIARQLTTESVLVNFGGDLAVSTARKHNACWSVGRLVTGSSEASSIFQLYKGAIATSGDAHRYLLKDGVRYSHILNPKTGWPVTDAPHTVSVAAATCVEAGMLSTLAMLQGAHAEAFLKLQEVDYWTD